MIRFLPRLRVEKVTLLGSLLGVVAFFLPIVVLKPNRVAEGTPHALWELHAPLIVAFLAVLVGTALILSLGPQTRLVRMMKVTAGILIFVVAVGSLIRAGSVFITPEMPFGRTTPGSGFWLAVLATFVITDGSLRNASIPRGVKSAIGLTPLLFLAVVALLGMLDNLAILKEFHNRESRFVGELLNHIYLSFSAVFAAILIGVPLGLLAWRRRKLEKPVFVTVNGIQTIPSLALFGLMIAPLAFLSRQFPVLRDMGIQGIGNAPALIALTLYALLPIVRNTYTSLAVIPDAVIDAGTGMGMGKRQLLHFVEVPMSLPIVLGGIRISAVQAIGNTAVAALIGAGGLGAFVFQGLGQAAPDLIVMGVLPIIFLAVLVDRTMGLIIRQVTPKGLRSQRI